VSHFILKFLHESSITCDSSVGMDCENIKINCDEQATCTLRCKEGKEDSCKNFKMKCDTNAKRCKTYNAGNTVGMVNHNHKN
jgi:hypothetical protein